MLSCENNLFVKGRDLITDLMSSEKEDAASIDDEEEFDSVSPIKGKLPKVGDIIEIPVGIRWEYPKKKRGTLTKEEKEMAMHRKKFYKTGGKRTMATQTPPLVDVHGEIVEEGEHPTIRLSFSA